MRSVMGYVGTYVTKRSGHIRTPKCSNFFSFTDTAAGRTRMHIGWREGEIFLDIDHEFYTQTEGILQRFRLGATRVATPNSRSA